MEGKGQFVWGNRTEPLHPNRPKFCQGAIAKDRVIRESQQLPPLCLHGCLKPMRILLSLNGVAQA